MTGLQILDRSTGEILRVLDAQDILSAAGFTDIELAESTDLAEFAENLELLRQVLSEARGITSDEFIARMDRRGKWTLNEGDYKIVGSSPEAGTIAYDTDLLRVALGLLVDARVIDQAGASAALEAVPAVPPISYQLLRDLRRAMDAELDNEDYELLADTVDDILAHQPRQTYRQIAGGIKALLKIPMARPAIEECRIEVTPPRRTAKVKRAS